MLDMSLNVLMILFGWVENIFTISAILLLLHKQFAVLGAARPHVNWLWKVTKWPMIVGTYATPVMTVIVDGSLNWAQIVHFGISLLFWHCFKDIGDDDFTKKLKDKVKEKVQQFRGKLIVVPETA